MKKWWDLRSVGGCIYQGFFMWCRLDMVWCITNASVFSNSVIARIVFFIAYLSTVAASCLHGHLRTFIPVTSRVFGVVVGPDVLVDQLEGAYSFMTSYAVVASCWIQRCPMSNISGRVIDNICSGLDVMMM